MSDKAQGVFDLLKETFGSREVASGILGNMDVETGGEFDLSRAVPVDEEGNIEQEFNLSRAIPVDNGIPQLRELRDPAAIKKLEEGYTDEELQEVKDIQARGLLKKYPYDAYSGVPHYMDAFAQGILPIRPKSSMSPLLEEEHPIAHMIGKITGLAIMSGVTAGIEPALVEKMAWTSPALPWVARAVPKMAQRAALWGGKEFVDNMSRIFAGDEMTAGEAIGKTAKEAAFGVVSGGASAVGGTGARIATQGAVRGAWTGMWELIDKGEIDHESVVAIATNTILGAVVEAINAKAVTRAYKLREAQAWNDAFARTKIKSTHPEYTEKQVNAVMALMDKFSSQLRPPVQELALKAMPSHYSTVQKIQFAKVVADKLTDNISKGNLDNIIVNSIKEAILAVTPPTVEARVETAAGAMVPVPKFTGNNTADAYGRSIQGDVEKVNQLSKHVAEMKQRNAELMKKYDEVSLEEADAIELEINDLTWQISLADDALKIAKEVPKSELTAAEAVKQGMSAEEWVGSQGKGVKYENKELVELKKTIRDINTNELESFIESRYEAGATQEEIDFLEDMFEERITDEVLGMTEEDINMSEDYVQGSNLEESLIDTYKRYLLSQETGEYRGTTTQSIRDGFLGVVKEMSTRPVLENVTNEQAFEAAKELYEEKQKLLERIKNKQELLSEYEKALALKKDDGDFVTKSGPIDWDAEVTPQSVAPDAQGKTSLEDKIQALEETQARRETAQEVLKAVQKERSAWAKMIKPYEGGQLAEEISDIPKKYISTKGVMSPDDAAKSIGLEGDIQLADYFKNLDMQAERLKKEIRDTAPEYLRMKEITILKKKLDAINTGMQKGKVDARKEIQQLQSELIGVIKNLDIEAKDKAKFLDTIKRANTIDALDKEINNVKIRAERYAEASAKKDLLSDIKKELKYTKPVKQGQKSIGKYDYESNVQFETLRGYEKITQDDAISALSIMPTEGLSQYDLIKARFLSLKANGQAASVELYEQVLEDIRQLKNIGAQAKDDADFANRIERAQKTDEVINAIQKININKDSLPGKIEAAYRSGFGNTYSMLNSMVGKNLAEKYDPEVKEVDRDVAVFYKTNEIMDKVSKMFGLEDRKLLPNKLQELALNEIPATDVDGLTKNINKLQVMDIYNSVKNDLGRARYNNFYGEEQLGEILNTLTPSEVRAADYLQEVMQEYYPILNKRNIEITGRDLGRVDNYWPFTSETKPDVFDDMKIQGEIPSAMKARSQSEVARPIPTNAIGKALRHIKQAEHVKGLSREYEELKRIFIDRRVKHHLVEKFGENAYKDLMNQIDEISLNRVVSRIDAISMVMDKAVNNWVLAKIAFNPTILARQLGSTTNYIENMPAGEWAKGFMDGILTPKKTFDFMWENAPFLEARFNKGYSEALAEVMKGAEEINSNRSDWTKGLSAFARAGDITAIIYGGYPTVKYNIAQGKSLEEAFKIFQSQTLKAQQSGARSGLSRFQNTNNPIARLFLAFKNTASQYLRKQADAIIQFKNGEISAEQLAKVTTLYSVIQPLLYVFLGAAAFESVKFGLRALTGSDQEEIDAEKILEDSMLQVAVAPFSAIPVIDGIANYAIRRMMDKPAYQVMRTPLLDDIERALQKVTAEGAFDEPELVDLLEMFGVIGEAKTGLPIMTAVRYFKAIEE